ncbi:extracellular solute-binding protein [Paenibacillus sp. IB182496]|uniref:Extracellular solute-binding protein n=1 Tax=Paenibacillus sabuli TaxID=2772509 RepID=A0A927BU63_9BACL|nr:extracellular solute-binding protein [Paenibacillus sabuli]MBD2846883.1 extracellular solute-binding protein [Paenibacillus sabuli]
MRGKQRFGMLLLGALLVIMLAACSSGDNGNDANGDNGGANQETPATGANGGTNNEPAPPEEPEEQIELSFWTLGNTNYEELAEQWTAEHPNVKISIQNTGDQTAHHNNLTTALSAGSGAPDIFMLEIGFMERFIGAEDKFYNLNELGAEAIKSKYLDWKWQQASSVDGDFQIGLPTDIAPTVAYYRTDVAGAAGLPTDPAEFGAMIDTWDKFATVAADFTARTGKPFTDLKDLVYNALRDQADGEIYYSKEDGSFIGDTNPQVREAYDYTVKGIQEGWIGNWALWSPEWGQATNDGGFAVMFGPAWMNGNIKSNGPDSAGNWAIAQLPEQAGNWGGSFLSLPREGEHPEEAYAFIEWLVNEENQLETFKSKGLMPSTPALFEDEAFTSYTDDFFGGQAISVAYGEAAVSVQPVYYGPLHDQTDTYFKDALQNVMEKGSDPQAEWENAVQKAKTLAARS